MHVPHKVSVITVFLFCDMRGQASEREQIVRFEETDAVFAGEALLEKDFFLDLFD